MQQHLPCTPAVIGEALAAAAIRFAKENNTGYFPAIEFFKQQEQVDKDLIESVEQVSWLAAKLARQTIQSRLRPIFSSVQFQSIQCTAFAMPHVRPGVHKGLADCAQALAEHYTPDTLKIELLLTMMRRDSERHDDRAEPYARKMMFRWLESSFKQVKVTNSHVQMPT